jgi:hypothetical protein
MKALIAALGVGLIVLSLLDAFEAMLLPRRVSRQFRFARLFYFYFWGRWAAAARRIPPGRRRGTFLSFFGPLSILVLFGLWAVGTTLSSAAGASPGLGTYTYFSGVTFFTLGYGDVTPADSLGRTLAVIETGTGFGFLAVVISYLPVLYQAFSRREVTISLLDARAGSPPTAGTLLARTAQYGDVALLGQLLVEWERWAAEVLESHISFPILTYYRSQHDNQSWLAALTAILDASAIVIAGLPGPARTQARLTFAMARHAVVDLAQSLGARPVETAPDRLDSERLRQLRAMLAAAGLKLAEGIAVDARLTDLRGMYEPFVVALSDRFLMPLPPVLPAGELVDNWQTSAWMNRTRGFSQLAAADTHDDHLD